MKIAALIDTETVFENDPQFEGSNETIRATMEFHVLSALRALAHEVIVQPFGPDPLVSARGLIDHKPDLVFNLTEHFKGDRRQDAHIAGLLELIGVPFTGTGAGGLFLCRDKIAAKRLLGYHKIRVPHFFSVDPGTMQLPKRITYPLMVKPALEDGSDGISLASIVKDAAELSARISMIHERMSQPALCEEYIEGREIYVGITGNDRLTAYPAREIRFGKTEEGGPQIATARVKWDAAYRRKWAIKYDHAELDPATARNVARISKRIYRILQIRDYGRIDLRVKADGDIVFLEANPNPNLGRDEDLAEAAQKVDVNYEILIDRILKSAAMRYRR